MPPPTSSTNYDAEHILVSNARHTFYDVFNSIVFTDCICEHRNGKL